LALFATFSSLFIGSYHIDFKQIYLIVSQAEPVTLAQQQQWYVLTELRLPRSLTAFIVGALLGMAGCAMQGLVRNPLADPGLIGISGGAAAAAATSIAIAPVLIGSASLVSTSLAAFIGALLSVWVVVKLANQVQGIAIATLILAGVAINAFTGTIIGAISYIANDDALRQISYWSMGSLAGASWQQLSLLVPSLFITSWLFWLNTHALNLFALGEQDAACQGLNVQRCKRSILWTTAFAVAIATALCGIIGFVGLVVPHICRLFFGVNHRYLLPASGIVGGLLLIVSDAISRSLFSPVEIPIGIVTSAIGAPFFLYLLSTQHKKTYV
jgi:iron complex transport system permease protein